MRKVRINPGCIGCGLCGQLAPEVFHVHDKSMVKEDANIVLNDAKIQEAARQCPMAVIVYDQE